MTTPVHLGLANGGMTMFSTDEELVQVMTKLTRASLMEAAEAINSITDDPKAIKNAMVNALLDTMDMEQFSQAATFLLHEVGVPKSISFNVTSDIDRNHAKELLSKIIILIRRRVLVLNAVDDDVPDETVDPKTTEDETEDAPVVDPEATEPVEATEGDSEDAPDVEDEPELPETDETADGSSASHF